MTCPRLCSHTPGRWTPGPVPLCCYLLLFKVSAVQPSLPHPIPRFGSSSRSSVSARRSLLPVGAARLSPLLPQVSNLAGSWFCSLRL